MVLKGVDLASYQGAPDFGKMRTAGISFAITKVSEGTAYTFAGARRNRAEATKTGMVVGLYHFAKAGEPTAEADYFLTGAMPLADGEFLCLDWEVPYTDPVSWSRAWLERIHARTGLRPFIYLNASTVARYNWAPVAGAGHGLWLAKYDENLDQPSVPHFGRPVIKQYSDKGTVPGINGHVDLDVAYTSDAGLKFYGSRVGPPAPQIGPDNLPSLKFGDTGPAVASLQRFLNGYAWGPPLPLLPVTGNYLEQTAAVLKAAQAQMAVRDGDGRNIGPQTKRALWARGWRG